MSVVLNHLTLEQLLQRNADDKVIARPGEPIVKITPRDARRKVNGYVGEEISMMMYGIEPALVYSKERLVWRIPIVLASPMRGHIGFIGALDVDAHTSDLIIPANFVEEIEANARALLKNSPHSPES
jgi:hypothetical protein